MARPKSREKPIRAKRETMDTDLRLRLTSEEKEAFNHAATRQGLKLSAWVRRACLRAAGILPDDER